MSMSATVIADSISPLGHRLTTLELVYPRFIHAEFMTHRVFSRNASSSRAVPTRRLIEMVRTNPVLPVHWGKNQAGMQAREELGEQDRRLVEDLWRQAASNAAELAHMMAAVGAHKQIVNRILEPFLPIRVVVTATEWANFFALRRHPDAQPEIKALADLMWQAMLASVPAELWHGQWHLPYVQDEAHSSLGLDTLLKVSVARCARVSYKTHDGRPFSLEEDLELFERLTGHQPMHASPTEHQATPEAPDQDHPHLYGNLKGWLQYRKFLPNEFITEYKS